VFDALEDQIRELLASGDKIAAIKRFREATSVGLAEAKAAVEALEAGRSLTAWAPFDDSELTQQVCDLLSRGEKIEAVKRYRDRFHVGLRDAKEAVERIGAENGIPVSSGSGCFGVVLLVIIAAVLFLYQALILVQA
jgi:ribosomal protein L7/L12